MSKTNPPTIFAYLHRMWTRDVGREGYDKAEWKAFEAEVLSVEARLAAAERDALAWRLVITHRLDVKTANARWIVDQYKGLYETEGDTPQEAVLRMVARRAPAWLEAGFAIDDPDTLAAAEAIGLTAPTPVDARGEEDHGNE